MKEKKVVIIIPYFGKLPNYFSLWLESVRNNPQINVIFLTDNDKLLNCPSNVNRIVTTLSAVKARAQKLIDFPIKLNSPYKLVDYKPLYGEMFSDYISGYDWWGWGDIDTIWGNLSLILNETNLNKYDKILDLGHLTLMRNNSVMKKLWSKSVSGAWTYRDAFRSDLIYHFDEGGGMAFISQKLGYKIYSENAGKMNFADILPNKPDFRLAFDNVNLKRRYVFTWKNGILTGYWNDGDKIQHRKFAYIHLQKRKMNVLVNSQEMDNGILIIPNEFLPLSNKSITPNLIQKKAVLSTNSTSKLSISQRIIFHINYFYKKRKINKMRTIGKKRKIPINGNEVYFNIEAPKY